MQENTQLLQDNDEAEIDLLELARVLLAHWAALLFSAILVGALVFCYCKFFVTPMYQSTSELYVLSKSTSITSLTDLQVGSNLSEDYTVIITGRPVLEQVVTNLNLNLTYKEIYKKVDVETSSDRIISISVKDADPVVAKTIADEIAEVSASYIAQKMDQDPPNIIQYGYSDEDKVSPRTFRDTLIGCIVGFLIAAIIFIASYLMNDTIMTTEDVEKKLGINFLGSLPMDDGDASHSGKKRRRRKPSKSGSSASKQAG